MTIVPMISLFIAAVIAQPPDATYSTAGDPKAQGVRLSIRHPSSWTSRPLAGPGGVRQLRSPDGTAWVSVFVGHEDLVAAAAKQVEGGNPTPRQLLDSGRLDRHFTAGNEILNARTLDEFGPLVRTVDYFAPQAILEEAVYAIQGPRAVVVVFHIPPPPKTTIAPLLRTMVQSLRIEEPDSAWNSTLWIVIAGLVIVVAAPAAVLYRHRQAAPGRSASSSSIPRPR
jgi:hypothetical protein